MLWSSCFFAFPFISLCSHLLVVMNKHLFVVLFICLLVCVLVCELLMFQTPVLKFEKEAYILEFFWTVIPMMILVILGQYSLEALYSLDEFETPLLTVKISGSQWYWSYEYSNFENLNFDSFMVPSEELVSGLFRVLEVDNSLKLPLNIPLRLLISSNDVLHSWTVPGLGLKVDASPSRLNQVIFTGAIPGTYYGFCSEICGANHTFMPIKLEFLTPSEFLLWLSSSF